MSLILLFKHHIFDELLSQNVWLMPTAIPYVKPEKSARNYR